MTLTPAQIEGLQARLSEFRHGVNNHLARIVAAAELIRRRPENAVQFAGSLDDVSTKFQEDLARFSSEFERVLELRR